MISFRTPQLLDAVHWTLLAWVGVARDYDAVSMGPVLRALLQRCDSTPPCPSSLRTLVGVVSIIGPLLTTPLSSRIVGLPLGTLTPYLPWREVVPLVQLLVACVRSERRQLCPPHAAAVQLLTQLANYHQAQQVHMCVRRCVCMCVR